MEKDLKIPKKRGRKPKNQEIKKKNTKKRGRKPKPKNIDQQQTEKIPKKRGRKPKISSDNTSTKQINQDDTIILHIPIKENLILSMNDDIE